MDELKRYFAIANRLRAGQEVPIKDTKFFLEYSPKIDQSKLQKLVENGEIPSTEDATAALLEAGRALQSSPEYKQQTLEIAQEAEQGRLSKDLAQGIGLVLAGSDIAQSIAQIQLSKQQLSRSRKPARAAVPGRDQLLAQSLRQAQQGTNDAGRALAPVQANIQDQYQADLANAKTASTGQAGAFGAYGQLAANRRNRAAMDLAPIQDEIRRGQQARADNLLGMRMDETQQMFQNNASGYGQDLQQYNLEQQAAGSLGATGRSNLRNSLYGLAQQAAPAVADYATQRRYRNLKNKAAALYGPDAADVMVQADQNVNSEWGSLGADDTPIWKAY